MNVMVDVKILLEVKKVKPLDLNRAAFRFSL